MTAHASVDTAVKAMRLGAFHYLQKPLSVNTILIEVEKAFEHGQLLRERQALRERLSLKQGLGRILGKSDAIVTLREMIQREAKTDTSVLIIGETGTGKELVANALHYEGECASKPLIKVNCAALTESLLESELFGHEKGAFTGAEKRRAGRFERADGGTLFLDEISEMNTHLQAKLLRVLEDTRFERVGGDDPVSVDVRVVSATNRDPEEAVKAGMIRQDLYFRLNTVRIEVPPLRDRGKDIQLLAERFLSLYASKHKKDLEGISSEALAVLHEYEWPGNVRELEHCMERAVVLSTGKILEKKDLPPPLRALDAKDATVNLGETLNLQELEKTAVLEALEKNDWNKTRAAKDLGIYPSSLYKKMRRFKLPQDRPT
jgi:two-component system response regulator HydG